MRPVIRARLVRALTWGGFVAVGLVAGLGIGASMSDVNTDGSMLVTLSATAGLLAAAIGAALPVRAPAVDAAGEPASTIDLREPVVDLRSTDTEPQPVRRGTSPG